MSEQEKTEKSKKFRSPNYPFIGLEEAIKKADLILKDGGLHEVPFQAAMQAWDYKAGSTQQAIAALKGFGLVTVTGTGNKRKIQLTESARKILKPDHPERPDLLKKAVVMPTIYGDLWKKFAGDLPPSDSVIANYLEFDKKFNPDVIKGVIKDFRASISFANLSQSDKIETADAENTENEDGPPADSKINGSENTGGGIKKKKAPVKEDVMYSINLELLEDGRINILTSGDLNEKTFGLMADIFAIKTKHEVQPKTVDEVIAAGYISDEDAEAQ